MVKSSQSDQARRTPTADVSSGPWRVVLLAALVWALAVGAEAQTPAGSPGPSAHTVAFTTDEGTWMSVDASPDGRTLVFDLLGDLYTVPIRGGRARRLTEGPGFDAQPRFSQDGKSVVFVSDRDGADALWRVEADGSNARVVVRGRHLSPAWSPDGRCLVASRFGQATGSPDVVLYCGEGESGLKLGVGTGATFSSDGRYVYFIDKPGRWGWRHNLTVYDRLTRRTLARAGGARPAISPDGKSLVFAAAYDGRSGLKVQDMASGAERWLALGVAPLNVADPSRDALPGYAFTPDGRALITWSRGKLWRINIASGHRTLVPFIAEVRQVLGERVHFKGTVTDSAPPRARRIRSPRLSPDGKRLVFVALDKIWLQELPGGAPRRLTTGIQDEYAPTWSPDGRYVAYVTWGPEGGHIWRVAPGAAGARAERLTQIPAYFDHLAYTLDGRRLVTLRGVARDRLEAVAPAGSDWAELVWLPAAGGGPTVVTPVVRPPTATFVGQPFTTRDTARVYLTDATAGLVAMRWDGSDRQVIAKGPADEMVLSPDGRWLAVLAGETITVRPAPGLGGGSSPATPTTASPLGPTRTWPRHGADGLVWTLDGRTLVYAAGAAWYRYEPALEPSGLPATGSAPLRTGSPQPNLMRQEVAVGFARDVARGTIVLHGARLVTMRGREVLERGDLVITDGRIAAVGPNLPVPAGAHVVDVAGKTILPGYIDLWTKFQLLPGGHALQPWEFLAQLAYGVTAVREPGAVDPDAFDYAERVEAGELLGPRYLVSSTASSGDPTFSGDRVVRQAGRLATQALRRTPTTDAAVEWTWALTMLQDGLLIYMGTFPVTPMGADVVHLFAQSGAIYVPGLVQNDVGPWPVNRLIAQGCYHNDPKLQRFIPHPLLDQATLRRDWTRDALYLAPAYAADAARIVAAGGRIAVASRGAFPGLGMHWELWTLQSGGMPAHDVLRAGTLWGAEALGIAHDLGSLEPGKLADLQILDANPLENIRRTTALRYVMKGGRLYEAATLAEVWPRQRLLPPPWWLKGDPAGPMTCGGPSPHLTAH